jgi:hypothetical protein
VGPRSQDPGTGTRLVLDSTPGFDLRAEPKAVNRLATVLQVPFPPAARIWTGKIISLIAMFDGRTAECG